MLDCAFGATGTAVVADRGQCYAGPGYDGVSGIGTPKGLGVFAPISPTAVISHATGVTHDVAYTFSGATSTDPFPGGSIVRYRWTWGDGSTSTTTSTTASHTYASAGTRTVTLRVTDSYGRGGSVTQQVAVG